IVAAGFGTFPPEQIALLRGSVDRVLEVQEAIASSTPGAEHVLMTINAQDAPVALPLVGARRGMLLTTEHPTKARLRYGERFDIASLHGCRLFLTVAPEAMSPRELAVLARRFDTGLSPSMFKGSAPSGPTTAAPENRIPYREPSA